MSPALQKCSLRACAKTSYDQASKDIEAMMGVKIGHSTLHRMVARTDFPASVAERPSDSMSVDGGKVRLRTLQGSQ